MGASAIFACSVYVPNSYAADPPKANAKNAAPDKAAAPPPPYGHICEASISYFWKSESAAAKADANGAKHDKVFFSTVSEQGENTEEVKAKLNRRVSSVRARAIDTCRVEHQSPASCVSKKLNSLATDYPSMGYEQRAVMLKSIQKDCGLAAGSCLSTEVSDMKCWLNVSPEVVVPNEPKIEVEQTGNREVVTRPEATPAREQAEEPAKPAADAPKTKKPAAKEQAPEETPTPPADNPYSKPFSF